MCVNKSARIPEPVYINSREKELDYFSLMPFVWRKRCWLTAELLDPRPGFNADAWLMRSTEGIIIREGILVFSCVSQDGKTSQCYNVKASSSASDWFIFTIQQHRATSPCPQCDFKTSHVRVVTVNGRRSYGGKSHHGSNSKAPVETEGTPKRTNYLLSAFWQ